MAKKKKPVTEVYKALDFHIPLTYFKNKDLKQPNGKVKKYKVEEAKWKLSYDLDLAWKRAFKEITDQGLMPGSFNLEFSRYIGKGWKSIAVFDINCIIQSEPKLKETETLKFKVDK